MNWNEATINTIMCGDIYKKPTEDDNRKKHTTRLVCPVCNEGVIKRVESNTSDPLSKYYPKENDYPTCDECGKRFILEISSDYKIGLIEVSSWRV